MPSAYPTEHVLGFAYQQIGKPYQFAAAGPDAFDCSGLVKAAWQPWVNFPHEADKQAALCKPLKVCNLHLEVGDLYFYYTPITHVAIFVGYSAAGTPLIVQATDEAHGVQLLSATQFATPVLLARPPYVGWNHKETLYG